MKKIILPISLFVWSFFSLVLSAQTGDLLTVESIEFPKIKRTKRSVLLKNMTLKEGESYSQKEIEEGISESIFKLNSLGNGGSPILREEISIEVVELGENRVKLTVDAEDRWTLIPFVIPLFDTTGGFSILGGVADANFLGGNFAAVFLGMYSRDESYLLLGITDTESTPPFIHEGFFRYDDYLESKYEDEEPVYQARRYEIKVGYELGYDIRGDQSILPTFSTIISYKDVREVVWGKIPEDDPYVPYFLFAPGIQLGRIEKTGFLRKGVLFKTSAGISALYSLYPESMFTASLKGAVPFSSKSKSTFLKKSYVSGDVDVSGFQTNLVFPNVTSLEKGEIEGNWGWSANIESSFYLFSLFPKKFLIETYLPFWVEAGDAYDWKEGVSSSDQFQLIFGTGLSFYIDKIAIPLKFKVGYNWTKHLEGRETWYFGISVIPTI